MSLAIVGVIYLVIGCIFGAVAALYNEELLLAAPDIFPLMFLMVMMVAWPVEVIYAIYQWLK